MLPIKKIYSPYMEVIQMGMGKDNKAKKKKKDKKKK